MSQPGETSSHKKYSQEILIGVLLIFYAVGLIGLYLPGWRESFLQLSSLNLLLSFVILILGRQTQKQLFLIFLFICFLAGMAAEIIGIHTGWLFGDYAYGSNLGVELNKVPLIIGVNWGILSVSSCTVTATFKKWKPTSKALFSAFIMLLLDVLIEPVAVANGYWHWNSESIPVFNYICWFAIAFPLHFVYFRWKLDEQNKVAVALFVIMAVFFTILNFR